MRLFLTFGYSKSTERAMSGIPYLVLVAPRDACDDKSPQAFVNCCVLVFESQFTVAKVINARNIKKTFFISNVVE